MELISSLSGFLFSLTIFREEVRPSEGALVPMGRSKLASRPATEDANPGFV